MIFNSKYTIKSLAVGLYPKPLMYSQRSSRPLNGFRDGSQMEKGNEDGEQSIEE